MLLLVRGTFIFSMIQCRSWRPGRRLLLSPCRQSGGGRVRHAHLYLTRRAIQSQNVDKIKKLQASSVAGAGVDDEHDEMLIDIDDVLKDVHNASSNGLVSVVFDQHSPLVVGEEELSFDEWKKISFMEDVADGAAPAAPQSDDLLGIRDDGGSGNLDQEGGEQDKPIKSAYTAEQGFKEVTVTELHEHWIDANGDTGKGMTSDGSDLSSSTPSAFDVLIDVRTTSEYQKERIEGSVSIPMDNISEQVKTGEMDIYRGKRIALLCKSGMRSMQASVRLSRLFGFKDVYSVVGGIEEWKNVGYPVKV